MQTVYTRWVLWPGVHGYNRRTRKSSKLLKLCEISEFSEDAQHCQQGNPTPRLFYSRQGIQEQPPKDSAFQSHLRARPCGVFSLWHRYNLCSTISRVVHRNSVGKSPWGYHARSIRTLESWPQQDRGLQCYHWSEMFLKPLGHAYPLSGFDYWAEPMGCENLREYNV